MNPETIERIEDQDRDDPCTERPAPHRVHLSVDQIPKPEAPMPVLRLGPPTVAPDALIGAAMRAVAPGAALKPVGDGGLRAAYDGDRLVAYVHPETGESRVFPALEALPSGEGIAEHAARIAAGIIADGRLFPADATSVLALAPKVLTGSTHRRGRDGAEHADYLAHVRFQRQVDGAPVFGPGTRAMIAVGADATICGLAHRWREAVATEHHVAPHAPDAIAERIRAQLSTLATTADVRVEDVTIAYYDAGREFLQPVYRFRAAVDAPPTRDAERHVKSQRACGYVSIGAAPEPVPMLGAKPSALPEHSPATRRAEPPPAGDPTVGRYVVRQDSSEWVTSANEFMANLKFAELLTGGRIPFTDSQYYWAEPRLFTTDKDSFINTVNIALNEVHGNWDWFSTRDNNDDGVSLDQIKNPGYGGPGRSLGYWIIHSCEVIPTATDETTSFDVWWNIFAGLHAVVGYRTEMWIDDDVTGPFGFAIGLGAPFVGAWLGEVSSNDSYDDGDTYYDGNRKINEPMGRASAIAVTGHGDDTVNNLGSLGQASQLTEWWFNN